MMRRRLATVFFGFGCALSVFALAWFIAASSGVLIAPRTATQALAAFVPYAIVMLITLDRGSARIWPPVFPVTQSRLKVARLLLSCATMLCFGAFAIVLIGRALGNSSVAEASFASVIGSLMLLNGIYVALHWAYRPQNLFGPNVPPSLLNPLGIVLVPILRMTRTIKPPSSNGQRRRA